MEKKMNKFTCFFITVLFIIGCSEDSDSVKISKCLDNESFMVTVISTVDVDIKADDVEVDDADPVNENSSDVAKVISLENDLMIIELSSDYFNCSDALTYSVQNVIDEDTLLIDIVSNNDGPVALCLCRKTITIDVNEKTVVLEKIKYVRFKLLPVVSEYRDALFEK